MMAKYCGRCGFKIKWLFFSRDGDKHEDGNYYCPRCARWVWDNKGSNEIILSEEVKRYKRKMNDGD